VKAHGPLGVTFTNVASVAGAAVVVVLVVEVDDVAAGPTEVDVTPGADSVASVPGAVSLVAGAPGAPGAPDSDALVPADVGMDAVEVELALAQPATSAVADPALTAARHNPIHRPYSDVAP
jgi:hypothetical protein